MTLINIIWLEIMVIDNIAKLAPSLYLDKLEIQLRAIRSKHTLLNDVKSAITSEYICNTLNLIK